MRKFASLLLVLLLVSIALPVASADSLVKGGAVAKDSVEFYTIGNSTHTFSGVYDRMHIYLDLNQYPIPEPDHSDYSYVTGAHDEFVVLKDDDDSYDYIGYVCGPDSGRIFIIWSWSGYHKDGSLIGWRGSKEYFPLPIDRVSFPGGYPNADGVNIMHDATPGDIRSEEAKGIHGNVICSYMLENDGSISNIQVIQSEDPSLGKEATRVLSLMPNWIPAKKNGKNVRIQCTTVLYI